MELGDYSGPGNGSVEGSQHGPRINENPPDAGAFVTLFPRDYFDARDRFRNAVACLGWTISTHPVGANDDLTIDVSLSSPAGPEPVLFITTGVHGVEGFFGAAVQLALLECWKQTPPSGVRIVFAHAINPFGFAHLRRFNETNIDLNRNFLLDGEAFTGCPPLYARLDGLLNPKRPPRRFECFTLRALFAIARFGLGPLKQAIAGGQYDYPQAIFFGGHGPSESQLILREHLATWLSDAAEVVHLDFHTGLGPWGTHKLLIDPPLTPAQFTRAVRWFGVDALQPAVASGVAYQARGGFGSWCAAQNSHRDYLHLCAEFGTYDAITVLGRVRAENMSHHWGDRHDPTTKEQLKEAFAPVSPTWQSQVIADSVRLIEQAVAGLQSDSSTIKAS